MFDAPTTTQCLPFAEMPDFSSSRTTPYGVHGRISGWRSISRPMLNGWKPSTSLAGIDRLDDAAVVDVVGQGHLHQDAVDRVVGVQLLDQRQQLGLGRGLGQVVARRDDAGLLAGEPLVAHVHLRRRVVAHQDHGQARAAQAAGGQPVRRDAHFALDLGGDGLAVDDLRAGGFSAGHRCLPRKMPLDGQARHFRRAGAAAVARPRQS